MGTAIVSLPGALAACGAPAAISPPPGALPGGPPPAAPPARGRGGAPTYFVAFGVDTGLLRRVIARGLGRGGDFCEVFLQHRVDHWTGLEDGEVNRAYTEVALGAGIRVLKGDAQGYAFCEELTEKALLAAAGTAAAVADGTPTLEPKAFAAHSVKSAYAVKVPWTEIGVDRKLPLIRRIDTVARQADSRIVKVRAGLQDETTHILVADSDGRLVEDDQPMAVLYASCVAEAGGRTEQSGHSASARGGLGFCTHALIDKLARDAVEFTVLLFDAAPPPPGEYPVVLAPGLSGILLHEAIGHGMEADFNRKGISIYADRIGKRIAPKAVTIVDDGTNPRMRGSINVDDEGAPTERTVLVENGILRSYMHDLVSARHYKTRQTGSGRRESFRFPPVPRMRNTYMLDGPHAPEEVIASVKKGLYAEMFSNGQVHIGAGDFTFYLKHGRMIENGKLGRYVKDANLIGSGPKVLEKIDMVGSDLRMHSGAGYCGKDGQRIPVGFGLPTIRCGGVSVGGRKA
ncbi:MAG: TldD/PmbA family protein [Deltaproteobacteria bacterium]|nr:TldD/PmbA family protein [Deltaproteobacteria bacterium]